MNINLLNLSIVVKTDEDEVLQKIKDEFHFFITDEKSHRKFTVHIQREAPPKIPELIATKILSHAVVYTYRREKFIDYHGKGHIHQKGNSFFIYSLDEELLFELAFLTIHSLFGELAQRRSLYRIHALSGTYRKRDFILVLPSGGGKSSMLAEFLKDPEFKVISDDCPFIDHKGKIHSFPSKISLATIPQDSELANKPWHTFNRTLYPPKHVLSLSHLDDRVNIRPLDSRPMLILGVRSSYRSPVIQRLRPFEAMKVLLENMVIGVGLPQIIEIFLNFNYFSDFTKISKAIVKRSRAAINLYLRSFHCKIVLSDNIQRNCQAIKDLINEKNHR